jgi:hypothetical protein
MTKIIKYTIITLLLAAVGFFIYFNVLDLGVESVISLNVDKSVANVESVGNFYRNTKYHFSILFPEN